MKINNNYYYYYYRDFLNIVCVCFARLVSILFSFCSALCMALSFHSTLHLLVYYCVAMETEFY